MHTPDCLSNISSESIETTIKMQKTKHKGFLYMLEYNKGQTKVVNQSINPNKPKFIN